MKAQAAKSVNIISRDVIALTGVILYTILSSNGLDTYFATIKDGKTFCECKGFEFRGTCRHVQYIEQAELVATFDIHSAVDEIVEQAEAATLDQFYSERGAALQAAREASAAELLRIDAETQASMAAEASKRPHATCLYCGGNHNSSACYL